MHAIIVHLGNQITKQHLSIKLEGAVTFFVKTSLTYDTVNINIKLLYRKDFIPMTVAFYLFVKYNTSSVRLLSSSLSRIREI